MAVDLSVGLQRPLGWGDAKPCKQCGALVLPSSSSELCSICSGLELTGDANDWPAVVP